MASIVQHQHDSVPTVAFAAHQAASRPARKPRPIDLLRVEQIVDAVRKFGAISIKDLVIELRLSDETIRRHLVNLVAGARVVMLEESRWGSGTLYGPADLDEQAEFDLYRTRTSSWPHGQHGRDCMVAALFGAPVDKVCS